MKRYRLEGVLGEGAIGIVHLATDADMERLVAVKILKPGAAENPVIRKRFLREARLCAQMDHPNVVRVYDAGEEDGEIYLVMEHIEGEPLSTILERGDTELPTLMQILERVARGVHHAHKLGIVHRDLKPANILVTAGGVPKVADFGLAHVTESTGSIVTQTGTSLGTPLYMSPEQAEGRVHDLSPRSDVYAMGAILYEMGAGKPPFDARTVMEIYRKIIHEDPVPLRAANAEVHPDVEKIAMKALRKDPARRQQSAAEFADDLKRHLFGHKIQSSTGSLRMPGMAERKGKPRPAAKAAAAAGAPMWMVWSLGAVAAAGVITALVLGIVLVRTPAPERAPSDASAPVIPAPPSAVDPPGLSTAFARTLEESLPHLQVIEDYAHGVLPTSGPQPAIVEVVAAARKHHGPGAPADAWADFARALAGESEARAALERRASSASSPLPAVLAARLAATDIGVEIFLGAPQHLSQQVLMTDIDPFDRIGGRLSGMERLLDAAQQAPGGAAFAEIQALRRWVSLVRRVLGPEAGRIPPEEFASKGWLALEVEGLARFVRYQRTETPLAVQARDASGPDVNRNGARLLRGFLYLRAVAAATDPGEALGLLREGIDLLRPLRSGAAAISASLLRATLHWMVSENAAVRPADAEAAYLAAVRELSDLDAGDPRFIAVSQSNLGAIKTRKARRFGAVAMRLSLFREAEAALDRSLERWRQNGIARANRSETRRLMAGLSDDAEAARILPKALEDARQAFSTTLARPWAHLVLGAVLFELSKNLKATDPALATTHARESVAEVRKYLRERPAHAEGWSQLSVALAQQAGLEPGEGGDLLALYSQAIDALDRARALSPNEELYASNGAAIHYNFAEERKRRGLSAEKSYRDALELADFASNLAPDVMRNKYIALVSLEALGRIDEAVARLEKILKERPDWEPGRTLQARLLRTR